MTLGYKLELIKPFTMFAIAWVFFFAVFKAFIPAPLAKVYLAGHSAGAPPPAPPWCLCGASHKGHPATRW